MCTRRLFQLLESNLGMQNLSRKFATLYTLLRATKARTHQARSSRVRSELRSPGAKRRRVSSTMCSLPHDLTLPSCRFCMHSSFEIPLSLEWNGCHLLKFAQLFQHYFYATTNIHKENVSISNNSAAFRRKYVVLLMEIFFFFFLYVIMYTTTFLQ